MGAQPCVHWCPDYGLHLAGHRGVSATLWERQPVLSVPFYLLSAPRVLWSLSSLTKNGNLTLGSERTLVHQGILGSPFFPSLCCWVYEGGMDRKRHGKSCKVGIINRDLHSVESHLSSYN